MAGPSPVARTQRTFDAPADDWLTEVEAMAFLRIESAALFEQLISAGHICGVRRLNRQTRFFHWKGLVVYLLRLELNDIPTLSETGGKRGSAGADTG